MCRRLWHAPKISRKFAGECKIDLQYYGRENRTGYHPALVKLFRGIFIKVLGMYFSWEAKERNAPVVGAFTPVSFFVHRDDHPSLPIFRCFSRTPDHLTHTSQRKNSFEIDERNFKHYESNWISSYKGEETWKNNSPVNTRLVTKTWDTRNFSQNISHVKIPEVAIPLASTLYHFRIVYQSTGLLFSFVASLQIW